MILNVNNVCKTEYCRISDVAQYTESPAGIVTINTNWVELKVAKPPVVSVTESYGKPGRLYETSFSALLTEKLLNRDLLIVRLTFNDGENPMIIGDPDHPVRFLENHQLTSKNILFSHQGMHYPYREQADPSFI